MNNCSTKESHFFRKYNFYLKRKQQRIVLQLSCYKATSDFDQNCLICKTKSILPIDNTFLTKKPESDKVNNAH